MRRNGASRSESRPKKPAGHDLKTGQERYGPPKVKVISRVTAARLIDSDRPKPSEAGGRSALEEKKQALLAELMTYTGKLAELCGQEHKTDRQIAEMEDLCVLCEMRYGEEDERTMDTLHNTANLHAEYGEFDEAMQILERLYSARVKVNGRTHEKSLKCYALRAVVFEQLGKHAGSLRSQTELRVFGADILPELVSATVEECESIFKARRAKKPAQTENNI